MHTLRTGDPERIGEYTVLGRLGRGAMGTVYVPGPTLHEAVTAHGPLPEPSLRRLVAGLAEALLAIHTTGLVHRDLKPSNVLLAADGPRVIQPTRPYTVADPVGSRAVFRTSRLSAVTWGAVMLTGALTCSSIAGSASATGQDLAALLCFIGFVVLAVPAVRLLWSALRPRRWVEVSGNGLTLGRGSRSRHLAWSDLARVRIVEADRRPWLVVWLNGSVPSGDGLAVEYRNKHGGYRVFPVGHERRKRGRIKEVRELRAALGWYGGSAYDRSP